MTISKMVAEKKKAKLQGQINKDLYPYLSEEGKTEAQNLIELFKIDLKKAADETIGDLYCKMGEYIESDSWSNFRVSIMNAMSGYGDIKGQLPYDCKKIRETILKEHREELIEDLNQDLIEENKTLKLEIQRLLDQRY